MIFLFVHYDSTNQMKNEKQQQQYSLGQWFNSNAAFVEWLFNSLSTQLQK